VGLNYANHAEEAGMEIPERPLLFLKPPNAVAAHEDAMHILEGGKQIDYEAELGVVIDRQCRNVPESRAAEVIAGYTCVNDVSNRDDQEREQNWVRGKAFDTSAPIGPAVATPDEVPTDARIRLRVNGETKQDSSRSEFIFSVPELIAEISRYVTLEPGDVVSTGTPHGIGPVEPGDTMAVEIEGIGTLQNEVADSEPETYIQPTGQVTNASNG
jgi:2-keto-4-pentenoate hydratase/2-oxohepta-3-ene-1,7-dioic acid hydratase in catechol pathway